MFTRTTNMTTSLKRLLTGAALVGSLAGCTNQPGLFTNNHPHQNKTETQFAADSAKRHYEADAPAVADTTGRAQIDYQTKTVVLDNLTTDDWSNVEVWLDKKYVVFVPVMEKQTAKNLNFDMFFDDSGNYFTEYSLGNMKPVIDIYRDGKMFTGVPFTLPDH
jgi:type IV pilus biogenesis protein CpaD/CtpE